MNNLSSHFSELEFLQSNDARAHGINNTWESIIYKHNAIKLCENFLEPIRAFCIKKDSSTAGIRITSGYRNTHLNLVVGGASTSAHKYGYAVDMHLIKRNSTGGTVDAHNLNKFVDYILEYRFSNKIPLFDQLIYEEQNNGNPWIHFGMKNFADKTRMQLLCRTIAGSYEPLIFHTERLNINGDFVARCANKNC